MGIIKAKQLVHEYIRRDEEGNVESIQTALDHVDLDVKQGDFIAILGHNGSGKSTFLRSLNLLEVPTGGQILFEGTDITDPKVDINRHRQKIGMVFQQFNLFPHKTVKQNIMLAPVELKLMTKDEASKKADELLARVGLPDKANAYPDMLSGGQKQRIAIAGMLAIEPQVLVLDEATAMLDPLGRKDILRIVKDLNRKKGITVIMITQYMEEAVIADRVIVMNEGLVAFEGTPAEVFRRGTELRKINLDVPPMVELCDDLAASGIIKPCNAMTVEEMANELCPLLLKI